MGIVYDCLVAIPCTIVIERDLSTCFSSPHTLPNTINNKRPTKLKRIHLNRSSYTVKFMEPVVHETLAEQGQGDLSDNHKHFVSSQADHDTTKESNHDVVVNGLDLATAIRLNPIWEFARAVMVGSIFFVQGVIGRHHSILSYHHEYPSGERTSKKTMMITMPP